MQIMMSSALSGIGQLKRKRSEPGTPLSCTDIDHPIVLQAAGDEHDPQAPKVELRPRFLIPREYLPLAFTKRNGDSQPRLFHSFVSVLEELALGGHSTNTQAVIAVSKVDGAVFAIERIKEGLYAACPLDDWIPLDGSCTKPPKRPKHEALESYEASQEGAPWWDRAAVSISQPTKSSSAIRSNSLPKLISKASATEPKPARENAPAPPAQTATPDRSTLKDASTAPAVSIEQEPTATEDLKAALSFEEVAIALRTKYLEALYISKTSLAYFAKGPLARARNLVQHKDGNATARGLLDMLEELTMTVPMNDKKYSSTLADFLKEIPVGFLDDDDEQAAKHSTSIRKKGRKRKKMSKGGLLPCEEEYVLQWWQERERNPDSASVDNTHTERIKAGLAKQRTRETQLQILLILESMIAEQAAKDAVGSAEDSSSNQMAKEAPVGKNSKKPDLQALLDIHVDRLCIWQTTQSGFDVIDDGTRPRSSHRSDRPDKGNALQDFCTEVLVPFFASRIPKVFAQLCMKMDIVGVASPARHVPPKAVTAAKSHPRPGAVVSRKGLQRVVTEGNSVSKKIPSLSRSATETSMKFKREDSTLSLDDIPTHKPRPQPNLRYIQREVDLDALNKATETKLKRKALVEQELRSAINVLKKPNSRMAVKELVDFSDGRTMPKSKRKRDPVHITSQSPLVKVTPRANRVMKEIPRNDGKATRTLVVPPSSDQVIPSSSRRPGVSRHFTGRLLNNKDDEMSIEATPSKRSNGPLFPLPGPHGIVTSTPSRPSARNLERLDPTLLVEDATELEPDVNNVSPIAARTRSPARNIIMTPTKSRNHHLMPPPFLHADTVVATPVKAIKSMSTVAPLPSLGANNHPGASHSKVVTNAAKMVDEEEVDVYELLGWDDEDDGL